MSASRLGNLISINIQDFLLNKDDFMSLLYIEEDEADEAPPKRFIRKKYLVHRKNVVENLYTKNSRD